MRLRPLIAALLSPLAVLAIVSDPTLGQTAGAAKLEERIDKTRGKIDRRKGKEKVLTTEIVKYDRRIATLQKGIDRIAARQDVVQADLDEERGRLDRLQADLRSERKRSIRLRARLAEGREILAKRLVELYQADKPDLVGVVLNSNGFAELLQRTEFIARIGRQDRTIIARVRTAKKDAADTIVRLDKLEGLQAKTTAKLTARRDEIAALKQEEIDARAVFDRAREGKEEVLTDVRSERKELEGHLVSLEKEQAKVEAALANPSSPPPSGSFRGGGGSLAMPVQGTFTSPFGARWGRLHAGVDIAAPEGAPIYAADSGRVVLAAWTGGYGNYTCVQHTTSMSTCYAHQSRYGTTVGAGVKRGQQIGYVGNTGNSFGAHLHFEVRINGTPTNPVPYL